MGRGARDPETSLGSRACDRSSLGALAAPALFGFVLLSLELVDGHAQDPASALHAPRTQERGERESRDAELSEPFGAFAGGRGFDEPPFDG
jgi:hypothetical protein